MNINKIYYNEDLTILSQTSQPIRAFAQQANTIEICAPVSGYNTAFVILQGLASGVVNPRLRATERLLMSPLEDDGSYKRWNFVIPGATLNDMSLMNSTGIRVAVEFWYISGNCIGVEKYNVEEGIADLLAADYPGATDGQFVRVIDTNTDWYYDADTTTWIDYEDMYLVGTEAAPTTAADFALEKGIYTGLPSHAPTNTEYIISLLSAAGVDITAIEALLAGAVLDVNGFKKVVYDVTDPATELGIGETRWNDSDKTLETKLNTDVTLQHGQEVHAYLRNASGGTVANGTVVYVKEATIGGSTHPLFDVATNANDTGYKMIGVATEEIANNAYGFITLYGELGLTAGHGFTAGQVVYLGVDGALTATQPTAPAAKIKIGVVAPGDRLLVIPHIHFKLESASNFFINTAIADTDVIIYDGANGRWNNISKTAFLQATNDAIALKLSKDLSVLTDGGQIASNDLIYVYTNDGVPTKVAGSELTQLIKTITMNTSTYVLTITKYDGTQTTIDLPAEMAFVSASYSDVTQDLTFTLQNGSTVTVPLDDLVGGLASEDWVALNYVAKTQIVNDLTTGGTTDVLSAEQGKALQDTKEALSNKAIDFSVVNDTKYPSVKAVDDRIKPIELDIADHSQLIADTQETLRKALNSDGTSIADDDGTGIIAMGKDVAPAPLKVLVEGLLLDAPQLVSNAGNPFVATTGWTSNGSTGTLTVESGQLKHVISTVQGYAGLKGVVTFTDTNKYYIGFTITPFRTHIPKIYMGAGSAVAVEDTVTAGVKTRVSTIKTSGGTGSDFVIYDNGNATTEMDIGDITYYQNIQVYNISTLITNKQYSPLYSTTFDLMSDAQIKAQMDLWVLNGTLPRSINAVNMNKRLRATGKNLFDKLLTTANKAVNENTGALYTASGIYVTDYIKLLPSTNYVRTTANAFALYDINKVYISGRNAGSVVVTTTSNSYFIRINIPDSATLSIFQLEQGSVATTYEPYKHSDMFLKVDEVGDSYQGTKDSIEIRDGKAYFIKRINATRDGLLATPITTEIASSGILNGYPSGHIYIDDIIKDADVYTTSISITDTDWPITSLESIVKLNVDGSQTELATSGATIAGGGLSFTHTGLTAGDIVVFTYRYGTGLRGLTTVTYYDDPMIVAGSGTTAGKVYKIVPTVVDANIVWTKVEV